MTICTPDLTDGILIGILLIFAIGTLISLLGPFGFDWSTHKVSGIILSVINSLLFILTVIIFLKQKCHIDAFEPLQYIILVMFIICCGVSMYLGQYVFNKPDEEDKKS